MSVLLEISDLYKNFSGVEVIRGFNLSLNERTLSCLVGPNGAGKTTTIDLITGRLTPTSGTISFKTDDEFEIKRDITGLNESQIAHMGISRKFQVPAVFKELTVRQNLEVAFSNEVSPFKAVPPAIYLTVSPTLKPWAAVAVIAAPSALEILDVFAVCVLC